MEQLVAKVRSHKGERCVLYPNGLIVGRIAKAMGMDVLAFTARPRVTTEERKDTDFCIPETGDPNGTIPISWYSGLDKVSVHEFLSQGLDVLVLCLPLT